MIAIVWAAFVGFVESRGQYRNQWALILWADGSGRVTHVGLGLAHWDRLEDAPAAIAALYDRPAT